MGIIATAIKEKLSTSFNPTHLDVIDESHLHAGHAGARAHADEHGSGESHFHVIITAESLAPMSRIARHRAVMDVLSEEMPKIHAFRLTVNAA
jgi:BolA protein